MPTIKLVVIGSSGVGKTSLRGQYISGRFSHGYRATIGADFITKTLPHPTNPGGEKVVLQIWDTAGQERFSSLSTSLFRGADAALLMFDVNAPDTLRALTKWWDEFCASAPVGRGDGDGDGAREKRAFCCVVVGNKIDLPAGGGGDGKANEGGKGKGGRVTESEARAFLDELVPPVPEEEALEVVIEEPPPSSPSPSSSEPNTFTVGASDSITIHPSSSSHLSRPPPSSSRQQSLSPHRVQYGTLSSTHSALSTYHTPSSSIRYAHHTPSSSVSASLYESARSSPEPWGSGSGSPSTSPSLSISTSTSHSRPTNHPRRLSSASSTSSSGSSSGMTITPRLFARTGGSASSSSSAVTTPEDADPSSSSSSSSYQGSAESTLAASSTCINPSSPIPTLSSSPYAHAPPTGPALFFTSAKTGAGVPDVFAYIAARVVARWEWEEGVEARRMGFGDWDGDEDGGGDGGRGGGRGRKAARGREGVDLHTGLGAGLRERLGKGKDWGGGCCTG